MGDEELAAEYERFVAYCEKRSEAQKRAMKES